MDPSPLTLLSLLALSVGLSGVVLGLVLVVVFTGFLVLFRRRSQKQQQSGSDSWEVKLRMVCEEVQTAVDELSPQWSAVDPPSPSTLTSVAARLRRIDGSLTGLVREAPARASEAAEDIHRVSVALQSALQAERSSRLTGNPGNPDQRVASTRRLVERAAELEMAVQAALRLVSEHDIP